MALFTEQAVRANIRVRDGKRVFYLGSRDQLTPSARQWLSHERVEIIPAGTLPKEQTYTTLFGGVLHEKPEHMTHLYGNVLVFKDHPRIVFRGMLDTLEAETLLCQKTAHQEGYTALPAALQQVLDFVRRLIPCDVLNEPVGEVSFGGMTPGQLREHSHYPQKYYDTPHFMPDYTMPQTMLALNHLRTVVRRTELAAYRAFRTEDGAVTRDDMILALNRLSSYLWILMIQLKAGKLERK